MLRKTILLVVFVLLSLGLAACSGEGNTTISRPDQHSDQNDLMEFDADKISPDAGFELELGVGVDSSKADALLRRLPVKTLAKAEVIVIESSPISEDGGFSVVAAWEVKGVTHCEIWEIDLSLNQLSLKPNFTIRVVDEENGAIFDQFGKEVAAVSQGKIVYGAQYKIDIPDEVLVQICDVLVYFNDYICPILSYHPIGSAVCTFTDIVEKLIC